MKLTNRANLPAPIVEAIRNDSYSKGEADFSVTELLRPPRIGALALRHEHELEEDASERIWALLGQVMHGVLERAGVPERRFAMSILGATVSGKPDRFKDGVLQDWKFVTAWKAKGGVIPLEYEQQLNLYAALMRLAGYEVRWLESVLILRDWSKLEMMRNEDYPRAQIVTLPSPIWTQEKAIEFLTERVQLHLNARKVLPECSKEERWAKDDVYAAVKKGNKKATRLLNNPEAAAVFISEQKKPQEFVIVKRPGENTRCEAYCPVAKFCSQYANLKRLEEGNE